MSAFYARRQVVTDVSRWPASSIAMARRIRSRISSARYRQRTPIYADYLMMRAPRPTLVCCATQELLRHPRHLGSFRARQNASTASSTFPTRSTSSRRPRKHGLHHLLRPPHGSLDETLDDRIRRSLIRQGTHRLLGSGDPVFPRRASDADGRCTIRLRPECRTGEGPRKRCGKRCGERHPRTHCVRRSAK